MQASVPVRLLYQLAHLSWIKPHAVVELAVLDFEQVSDALVSELVVDARRCGLASSTHRLHFCPEVCMTSSDVVVTHGTEAGLFIIAFKYFMARW